MKDRMIEAYERGECGYYESYDYVREQMADRADMERKAAKEAPPVRPGITEESNPDEYAYLRREAAREREEFDEHDQEES